MKGRDKLSGMRYIEKFGKERKAKSWEEKSTTELRWENPRGKGNREGIIPAKGGRKSSIGHGKGKTVLYSMAP